MARYTLLVALLCAAPSSLSAWTVPSRLQQSMSRRGALTVGSLAGAALATVPGPSSAANVKAAVRSQGVLKENLVLILRVREATTQETRLIETGKYKELQRLNIKRAVKFMLDNYSLRDRFVTASAYASASEQQDALQFAQTAVESLIQVVEYFPRDLVANDLSPEQRKFVLSALGSTQRNIDGFLQLMPAEAVAAAKTQIEDENKLNVNEYSEFNDEKLINVPAKS